MAGLRAEDKARTLDVLRTHSREINHAAEAFHVPARLLAAAIYADRRMHYNLLDQSLDMVIARQGRNNSIGVAQIRVSTGLWVCRVLADTSSPYHLDAVTRTGIPCSGDRDMIIEYLSDPPTNLMYAAAYSAMILKRWRGAGIDISDRVEVFATLFNLGPFRSDGTERTPHLAPRSSEYGYVAQDFYSSAYLRGIFPVATGSACAVTP